MRTYDLSRLYRTAIGFDRLQHIVDEAMKTDATYPPYNVELVAEDQYRVTMAVAGFERDELEIISERNMLRISGRKNKSETPRTYLHRGLATRDFEQRFQLADHVKVVSATINNGLLHVELVREVPEALRPRKIVIDSATPAAEEATVA